MASHAHFQLSVCTGVPPDGRETRCAAEQGILMRDLFQAAVRLLPYLHRYRDAVVVSQPFHCGIRLSVKPISILRTLQRISIRNHDFAGVQKVNRIMLINGHEGELPILFIQCFHLLVQHLLHRTDGRIEIAIGNLGVQCTGSIRAINVDKGFHGIFFVTTGGVFTRACQYGSLLDTPYYVRSITQAAICINRFPLLGVTAVLAGIYRLFQQGAVF